MNRQNQGLFEAPLTSEATLYTNLYSNPEWEAEWELPEAFTLGEEEWETVGSLKIPKGAGRQPPVIQRQRRPSMQLPNPAGQTMQRTVYGWRQYRRKVEELPPDRQAILKEVGNAIVASYQPGRRPVRTVQVYGHADWDTPRNPQREKQMSDERARMVADWLKKYVGSSIAARIAWDTKGFGATNLKGPPTTEANRRQNRRVEISVRMQAEPPSCPYPPTKSQDFNVWLQRTLNQVLGIRLPVSGLLNTHTRSAIKSFQARQRLSTSGEVDRATLLALLKTGVTPPPCSPLIQCSLFLPANPSQDWLDYIAAQTTGRITPLINGRDSGGPGSNVDRVEAFELMERTIESLGKNDSVYLAAWQFDPKVPLVVQSIVGITDWGLLLHRKAQQGVKIRIIMTDFAPIARGFHSQLYQQYLPALNQRISQLPPSARDNLKYLVSRHPATWLKQFVGSHHQKFMVVRKGSETIAFCGGLDIAPLRTSAYWGTNLLAWHDIHVQLEGQIARDLEREFILRWNREKDSSVVPAQPGWNHPFETLNQLPTSSVDSDSNRNRHSVQMLRTVSVQETLRPLTVQRTIRDDIWQAYKRLLSCASQFIFMENQYFREPQLADEIIRRVKDVPNLVVIVVVPSALDEGSDPITEHGNALQFDFFTRLFNALSPNQLRVYTMFKRFIHSKFILIDDRAMSIGSANANPRSFQLDTELNVVVDQPNVVKSFRHRLWSHDLGTAQSTTTAWKVSNFIPEWDKVANTNAKLTNKPNNMMGEGVLPFDPRSIRGRIRRIPPIPNVLAEAGK